ncbi:hypothetical protein SRABI128_04076 [Microbacterium sp. Bi128]|nr:hypothetical protein SRABI128_04076 [Microbacterium sp. Bi128]
MPSFWLECASLTWASSGISGSPPRPWSSKSGAVNSSPPESGAPAPLVRPISASCSRSDVRSQISMCIRIRRATRYVPPAIQPSSGRVPWPAHTCSPSRAVSSALRLLVPSLKPKRFRGVACDLDVEDVRPKPSWDQRTRDCPKPMRARLRIAWTATWGSSAQACTTMSPPVRPGWRSSPGKCGRSISASGRRPSSPKRALPSFSNRPGPNPKVRVSLPAPRSRASPVSSGGAS